MQGVGRRRQKSVLTRTQTTRRLSIMIGFDDVVLWVGCYGNFWRILIIYIGKVG